MNAPIAEAARQEIARANHLLEAGHPAEAAESLAQVSALAEQHGFPGRAAHLSARAAHAFLEAKDAPKGVAAARRALRLSLIAGGLAQTSKLAQRILAEFEARGYGAEAQELRREIDQHLQQQGLSLSGTSTSEPTPRLHLPAQCPSCLGPVRPDEVEWADDSSAVCAYCGSVLQAS